MAIFWPKCEYIVHLFRKYFSDVPESKIRYQHSESDTIFVGQISDNT